jgi:hypothetical protein
MGSWLLILMSVSLQLFLSNTYLWRLMSLWTKQNLKMWKCYFRNNTWELQFVGLFLKFIVLHFVCIYLFLVSYRSTLVSIQLWFMAQPFFQKMMVIRLAKQFSVMELMAHHFHEKLPLNYIQNLQSVHLYLIISIPSLNLLDPITSSVLCF